MTRKGHPVLGAVMGLLFGFSLAVTLLVFGVLALDSILVLVLPLLLLVVGAVWGKAAPLGARSAPSAS